MSSGLQELNIAVTGGTGFVGSALIEHLLALGHRVKCVTRRPDTANLPSGATPLGWESLQQGLVGVDAVVHLAGEQAVGKRLNEQTKKAIMDSRVETTKALVGVLRSLPKPPGVFVCASAIGYYGDRPFDDIVEEDAPPGDDFLARVCVNWEEAARQADDLATRVVRARIGIVLGDGGPLKVMALPFKMFVGGPIAGGKQPVSWIDRRDAARALLHCIQSEAIRGAVNIVSPYATTNAELSNLIAKTLKRPNLLPVPKFGLRLLFSEGADTIASGQHVRPGALVRAGFQFEHEDISEVIRQHLAG